ncbi:MAG: GNAT family N-acetyltransferase, partial [Bacteroidota bacterium]
MTPQLIPFTASQEALLIKLLTEYFLELEPSKIATTNGIPVLDYPYLSSYWTDHSRVAYGIYTGSTLVGFALVNDYVIDKTFRADLAIAEFYIRPPFRKQGLGRMSAHQIFSRFPGKWEVKQDAVNVAATSFWRSTIGTFTK